jgi:5-methylcytosine-specific restriction endonuclease McrA
VSQIRNQRRANVDYYRRNREQELFRVKVRQAGTRDMLREWRDVPCADCGKKFEPFQMDFDHRDPSSKLFNLTAGRAALMSTAKLRIEAAKCDIVCANCHRVRTVASRARWFRSAKPGASPHLESRKQRWRHQARALLELRKVPCTDCLQSFSPYSMEFDHRDPSSKRSDVMEMVSRAGMAAILREVAKCDVVCANCHRMRTYERRQRARERE